MLHQKSPVELELISGKVRKRTAELLRDVAKHRGVFFSQVLREACEVYAAMAQSGITARITEEIGPYERDNPVGS
jgi:hypothetical protein